MSDRPDLPGWLRPLWVRIAFVIGPAVIAAIDFSNGNAMWGALFAAAALWGAYSLIYAYPPDERR